MSWQTLFIYQLETTEENTVAVAPNVRTAMDMISYTDDIKVTKLGCVTGDVAEDAKIGIIAQEVKSN